MNKGLFIAGIVLIAVGSFFWAATNSAGETSNRTYSGTKSFTAISDATQYQQESITEGQKDKASVNSNISVDAPPTVSWSAIMPNLTIKFPYGTADTSTGNFQLIVGFFAGTAMIAFGVTKIMASFSNQKKSIKVASKEIK